MLIGEAPCTKDLISCTDHDFEVVSLISIIAIFIIIALVLRSISLPVILVAVIETAIAANLCIPYYTNVTLPFVAPILIFGYQHRAAGCHGGLRHPDDDALLAEPPCGI